jgi:hypothetical protein
MTKFSSLSYLKQQHSSVFAQSWIYAGITAWFSQQDRFAELEFSDKIDSLCVQDYWDKFFSASISVQEKTSDDKKYFGLINEGSPEYWFRLDEWHHTVLVTGHDNFTQWQNNNISIGFDRWDFWLHKVCGDPRISQEINTQGIAKSKFDLLVLRGAPREHRLKWLKLFQDRSTDHKVLSDGIQTELSTDFRTTNLGYEQYFNKLNCEKFQNYNMLPSFYDEADTINLDFLPHRKLFQDCLVNIILETTVYNTTSPFFTEKTYKALINARPFVILGDTNSLLKLRQEGFKTFDNFCDESYDLERDLDKRIEKTVTSTIQLIDACRQYPKEIDKICQYNQQLFFNRHRLERKLAKFGKLCLTQLYQMEID